MTMEQARNILGISHSAGLKTVEQIYRQKCRQLQIRMVPGNPCSERMKAQTDIAELTTAWHLVSNGKSTENKNQKPRTAAKQYPANRKTTYASPQNLGSLWDEFVDMLPISKSAALILLAAMFFLVIVSVLKLFMKGFKLWV